MRHLDPFPRASASAANREDSLRRMDGPRAGCCAGRRRSARPICCASVGGSCALPEPGPVVQPAVGEAGRGRFAHPAEVFPAQLDGEPFTIVGIVAPTRDGDLFERLGSAELAASDRHGRHATRLLAEREETCGVSPREETCGVSPREETCGVSPREETCGVSPREETCGVSPREETCGVSPREETCGVSPREETCGVSPREETCGVSAREGRAAGYPRVRAELRGIRA